MEKKATYLPPTFLRDLQKVVELYRRIGLLDKLPSESGTIDRATPIYFKNVSGETIPPYACMQVTGTVEEGSQNYLEVDKPADADGTAGQFLFNGHNEVASNDTGIAQDCAVVRAFKNSGTVTAGGLWGPTVGQWYLTADAGSYVAAGEDDIATNVLKVFVISGGGKFAAKLTTSLATGTAAGTEIYSLNGMTLTYLHDATIYDPLFVFASLVSGDWLYCFRQGGKYYASDNANCSTTSPLIDTPPESGPPGEPV